MWAVPVAALWDEVSRAKDSLEDARSRSLRRGGWSWRQRGRMINVGVDEWGCGPVDEATLAAVFDDGPSDLAALPSSRSDDVIGIVS